MKGYEEIAAALRDATGPVRVVGAKTKIGWGRPVEHQEVSTAGLDQVLEHNEGDLTAVLQAGVPLWRAQQQFAASGQMLALDPPGHLGETTIGGIVAAGDSGPLRHRYGAARDLVLGMTVALPDGSVARSGGKVIKNVAGYDLPKLFAGSFGTLGAILELSVRLHPKQPTVFLGATADDPEALAAAASTLAHSRLEAQALDVAWWGGQGGVLVEFAGAEALPQARAAQRLIAEQVLDTETMSGGEGPWEGQRRDQRGDLVVRVSGLQTQLTDVLRAAERHGARLAGRAALGISWLSLPVDRGADAVRELRAELAPARCVVLDAPAAVRAELDPWHLDPASGAVALMRSVKHRFDPLGKLAPVLLA